MQTLNSSHPATYRPPLLRFRMVIVLALLIPLLAAFFMPVRSQAAPEGPQVTRLFQAAPTTNPGGCGPANAALNRPAASSSNESAALAPNFAVDGNPGTRWSSAWSDPQWIQVDLGSPQSICRVSLSWEAAYGSAYQIQVSNDAATWTTIKPVSGSDGGTDDHPGLSGSGRYVRILGTARATVYGYSPWEFQVYTR